MTFYKLSAESELNKGLVS